MKLTDNQVDMVINALCVAAEQCRHAAATISPHARETEGEVEALRRIARKSAEQYAALAVLIAVTAEEVTL